MATKKKAAKKSGTKKKSGSKKKSGGKKKAATKKPRIPTSKSGLVKSAKKLAKTILTGAAQGAVSAVGEAADTGQKGTPAKKR
ncbi:MAG TPA: hypothetical protein VJT71_18950 [Pyrinomonadaceae bacterium]|nr:hypothetical protein [Pyrinomonadaceae bacterium]